MTAFENIIKVCELIAKGIDTNAIKSEILVAEDEINAEMESLDFQSASELLSVLFPDKLPIDSSFYERLEDVVACLGFSTSTRRLFGLSWVIAYNKLKESDQIPFLRALDNEKVHLSFWTVIEALPVFLSEVELPSGFAAKWFSDLGNKVQGDLAGGGLFQGIQAYAVKFPQAALKILNHYIDQHLQDDAELHIAAVILGGVRSVAEEDVTNIDNTLKSSPRTNFRLCYYRSWRTTFFLGALPLDKFKTILDSAMRGEVEEQNETFDILRRCSFGDITQGFVDFVIQWLEQYVSPELTPEAKLAVVSITSTLCDHREKEKRFVSSKKTNKILISIQPIEKQYTGVWTEIEHYLVDRLEEDKEGFGNLLEKLAEKNPGVISKLISDRNLEHLIIEIGKSGANRLITNYIFSDCRAVRRLGLTLFQKIHITNLQDEFFETLSEANLRLAFYEFILKPFTDGKDTARYFLVFESLFSKASEELKQEVEEQMLFQAINYPGACLDTWKNVAQPSDLIQSVVSKANAYFEILKKTRNSPVNSFCFPEYEEAIKVGSRKFSELLSEGSKDNFLFDQLFTKVDLIYGRDWSILGQGEGGGPGDVSPLNKHSFSMEAPRLQNIIPEEMALNRVHAMHQQKEIQGEPPSND